MQIYVHSIKSFRTFNAETQKKIEKHFCSPYYCYITLLHTSAFYDSTQALYELIKSLFNFLPLLSSSWINILSDINEYFL